LVEVDRIQAAGGRENPCVALLRRAIPRKARDVGLCMAFASLMVVRIAKIQIYRMK
jgi:hypothetical protein